MSSTTPSRTTSSAHDLEPPPETCHKIQKRVDQEELEPPIHNRTTSATTPAVRDQPERLSGIGRIRCPGSLDYALCPRFGPAEPGQIPRRSPVRPPGPLRSQEISGPGSTDTHLRAGRRGGDRRALRTRLDESDATRPRTWMPSLQPSGGVHEISIGGSRDSPVATTVLSGELPPELLDPPPAR